MANPSRVRQLGGSEARTHLSTLMRSVAEGAVVIITRNGAPIAKLRSPAERALDALDAVIADARALRAEAVANGGRLLESPHQIASLVGAGRTLN